MSRTTDGMFLSHKQYAADILDRAGMDNYCKLCLTPVDTKGKLSVSSRAPYNDPTTYHSVAGALQ